MISLRFSRPTARLATLVAAAALCLSPIPATASPAEPAVSVTSSDTCLTGSSAGARTSGLVRGEDHAQVTPAQIAAADRLMRARLAAMGMRSSQARGSHKFHVPVRAHVIAGKGSAGPTKKKVRRQIRVLNHAYDGEQSGSSSRTRFQFTLKSFHRVHNQKWRTSEPSSKAQRTMRSRLHKGGRKSLNLYFAKPRNPGGAGSLLGFSSFPWNFAHHKKQDGVTVHTLSLPGKRGPYGKGDTVVHEVGHWLGLYHTFQGGCSEKNDRVSDTPAEGTPSGSCDTSKDTCPAVSGNDPVHNFMDYAPDACMDMFTVGQVGRMNDAWRAFRTP